MPVNSICYTKTNNHTPQETKNQIIRTNKPFFLINLGEEIKLLSLLVHGLEAHTTKTTTKKNFPVEIINSRRKNG